MGRDRRTSVRRMASVCCLVGNHVDRRPGLQQVVSRKKVRPVSNQKYLLSQLLAAGISQLLAAMQHAQLLRAVTTDIFGRFQNFVTDFCNLLFKIRSLTRFWAGPRPGFKQALSKMGVMKLYKSAQMKCHCQTVLLQPRASYVQGTDTDTDTDTDSFIRIRKAKVNII